MNKTIQDLSADGQKFASFPHGRPLLKQHSLNDEGTWIVRGEADDPGPFGSSKPIIGHVDGTLFDVIEWAVQQNRWYSWGGGGSIEKFIMTKPETIKV